MCYKLIIEKEAQRKADGIKRGVGIGKDMKRKSKERQRDDRGR